MKRKSHYVPERENLFKDLRQKWVVSLAHKWARYFTCIKSIWLYRVKPDFIVLLNDNRKVFLSRESKYLLFFEMFKKDKVDIHIGLKITELQLKRIYKKGKGANSDFFREWYTVSEKPKNISPELSWLLYSRRREEIKNKKST